MAAADKTNLYAGPNLSHDEVMSPNHVIQIQVEDFYHLVVVVD